MTEVTEISRENRLNRVLRENALAAMMLVLTMVAMINGIIIGIGINNMQVQSERYDRLKQHYDETAIYVRNLNSDLIAHGFEPPDPPQERD